MTGVLVEQQHIRLAGHAPLAGADVRGRRREQSLARVERRQFLDDFAELRERLIRIRHRSGLAVDDRLHVALLLVRFLQFGTVSLFLLG